MLNIKYKTVTRRSLKPDTSRSFTEYIFDNFKEKQAKMVANCFVGHLGTKYNKTNNGFACQDYKTAMNIWTSGLNEGMNITINNYNDLYLIKEQKIDCLVTHVVLIGLLFWKLFYMLLI